jgi:hypothetical protein
MAHCPGPMTTPLRSRCPLKITSNTLDEPFTGRVQARRTKPGFTDLMGLAAEMGGLRRRSAQPYGCRSPEDRSGTHVVDGVSAAGEVKSTLTTGELDDCIMKGSQFKRLRMISQRGRPCDHPKALGPHQANRFSTNIFRDCLANKIAPHTLGKRLQNAGDIEPPEGKTLGPEDDGAAPQPPLDAICILDKESGCSFGRIIRWESDSRSSRIGRDGRSYRPMRRLHGRWPGSILLCPGHSAASPCSVAIWFPNSVTVSTWRCSETSSREHLATT